MKVRMKERKKERKKKKETYGGNNYGNEPDGTYLMKNNATSDRTQERVIYKSTKEKIKVRNKEK